MLKSRRFPPFVWFVVGLLRLAVRRRFHGVLVVGAEHLRPLVGATGPLVGCANHTNWWDGFMVGLLTIRWLRRRFYVAQEERHLRRYGFFRYLGAFGVDLDEPRSALGSVRHAGTLLRQAGALVWIFPQGKLVAPDAPIEVRRGATFLAARAGARILPCALRYEFRDAENPSVIVVVGPPLPPTTSERALQEVLGGLVVEAKRYADPAVPLPSDALVRTKLSTNERWDAFVARLRRGR